MDLKEAKKILNKHGYLLESATGIDEFIEDLSNCVGHIEGDEVVFIKKIPYSSEYVVRTRNHNHKIANIWYDYDKDKIIVQMVPEFHNYEFDREELTVDKCKEIGAMIKTKVEDLDEAKRILKSNGYILERYELDYDSVNRSFDEEERLEKFGEYLYEVRELLVRKGFSRGKQADNYDKLHDIAHRCCRLGKTVKECANDIISTIK